MIYLQIRDALVEVLIQNERGPAHRSRLFSLQRLARNRPDFDEERYQRAIKEAHAQYSTMSSAV